MYPKIKLARGVAAYYEEHVGLELGELFINYDEGDPSLVTKDMAGEIRAISGGRQLNSLVFKGEVTQLPEDPSIGDTYLTTGVIPDIPLYSFIVYTGEWFIINGELSGGWEEALDAHIRTQADQWTLGHVRVDAGDGSVPVLGADGLVQERFLPTNEASLRIGEPYDQYPDEPPPQEIFRGTIWEAIEGQGLISLGGVGSVYLASYEQLTPEDVYKRTATPVVSIKRWRYIGDADE